MKKGEPSNHSLVVFGEGFQQEHFRGKREKEHVVLWVESFYKLLDCSTSLRQLRSHTAGSVDQDSDGRRRSLPSAEKIDWLWSSIDGKLEVALAQSLDIAAVGLCDCRRDFSMAGKTANRFGRNDIFCSTDLPQLFGGAGCRLGQHC